MPTKLPFDSFDYYYGQGPGRSYQSVADHYGVTKRAVTKRAMKERWQPRIAEMESRVRENVNKKAEETLEEMTARHMKQLKAIQFKAIETLRAMPLSTAMEAVRSLNLCMKQERDLREDPADQGENSIEAIIRREYQRWLEPVPASEMADPPEADDDEEESEPETAE